ncbi:phosphatase PAP2 family protein [Streptomyces capillispiralis]|uniref:PAP2 superfamily protein n=1 Tax=Streptomyces capillispiralis TaxID=68182 RepID=A0A561TJI9_9ACTN|nr:phosphatase PAP2 family protein [Streptomyces capillispiralis]TWF87298.1 PAP2 superfamily protein [Streptomyces capillispiralis]GHH92779.1 inositol phosphorylceramide synthase [Streptomyces capillispiralis]
MPHTETPGTGTARLRWWSELPIILVVYACYSAGRLIVRGDVSDAVDHGLAILRIEKTLYLNAEHPLNRLFTREPWLGIPADFWYASLHYLLTPALLVWLFRSHAAHYRAARTWLMTSTFIGLIGFSLLPTCPPRLLDAGHGFVDTMAHYSSYGWWGGEASAPRGLGGMTNQYAAMPSLHVGWALWCGVILWRYGRTRWTRAAAVGYPLITTIVVMGTANHYFLDAAAGAAVMGAGFLLAPVVTRYADRARARLLPRTAPVAADSADSRSPIVSAGCQTSAGERFPRQRHPESRYRSGTEPGASPSDAGEGAPAPAR